MRRGIAAPLGSRTDDRNRREIPPDIVALAEMKGVARLRDIPVIIVTSTHITPGARVTLGSAAAILANEDLLPVDTGQA